MIHSVVAAGESVTTAVLPPAAAEAVLVAPVGFSPSSTTHRISPT